MLSAKFVTWKETRERKQHVIRHLFFRQYVHILQPKRPSSYFISLHAALCLNLFSSSSLPFYESRQYLSCVMADLLTYLPLIEHFDAVVISKWMSFSGAKSQKHQYEILILQIVLSRVLTKSVEAATDSSCRYFQQESAAEL